MSTNKRIPKRSIIGTRVSVCCKDGVWRSGLVTAMRSREDSLMPMEKKFSVKLESSKTVEEFCESVLVGPGFLSVIPVGTELVTGQEVFVTNNGREVEGKVASHNIAQDSVEVEAKDFGIIYKKLEDIRLMESRKSARLVHTDTDFSLLADFNIVEQRKLLNEGPPQSRRRLHSMSDFHDRKRLKNEQERKESKRRQRSERGTMKSSSIDVPTLTSQSRKRRTSESRAELDSGYGSSFGSGFIKTGEENLKECTAAMVLMNLCVSPRDKWKDPSSYSHNLNSSGSNSSPSFLSDVSSPTTPRPSPANSLSHFNLDEDEEPYKRSKPNNVIYQCTWRGCNKKEFCLTLMERHVRQHLGLPEPPPGTDYEGEEDFYYTEIESDETSETSENSMDMIPEACNSPFNDFESNNKSQTENIDIISTGHKRQEYVKILPNFGKSVSLASSAPSQFDFGKNFPHPLGDHIGMVRPSYEAPTTIYVVNTVQSGGVFSSPSSSSLPTQQENVLQSPPTVQTFQGKKLVSIVPRPDTQTSEITEKPFVFKSVSTQAVVKSDKKCRKVYGLDQKDLWCTQCKWKKACGRFT